MSPVHRVKGAFSVVGGQRLVGQWAVQGPIAVEAAMQLGTDLPRIAMAATLGESWTNAIQPLYAIPVLAVAGLHIRDVVGYGVIICALNGTIYLTGLLFF